MVGSSGSAGSRFAPVVAIAMSFPDLMCGSDEGMLSNIMFVWPARRSVTAGALPLYGMCTMSVFVRYVNIAPDMWMLVPLPLEAYVYLPGFFFASSITSLTLRGGNDGCTTSTLLSETIGATGARSLFTSSGIFVYRKGLIAWMPLVLMTIE